MFRTLRSGTRNLELERFDWHNDQIVEDPLLLTTVAIDRPTDKTFVRTVRICNPPAGGLIEILKITDEELDRAAELCKIKVVEHTWGLAKIPRDVAVVDQNVAHPGLPRGHALVARTNIIDGHGLLLHSDPQTVEQINTGMVKYQTEGVLGDMGLYQCMEGTDRAQTGDQPITAIVDIEPKFRKQT